MMRKALAAIALGAALTACGSGSGATPFTAHTKAPVGYNNPEVLAASIAETVDEKQTDGSTITVICILKPHEKHVFICNGTWSDDTPGQTVTATVSDDGLTWIT